MKTIGLLLAASLVGCASTPSGDRESNSADASYPSLSMWSVNHRGGVFQINVQNTDRRIVVTKIVDAAGTVLFDYSQMGGLTRFKGMFKETRRFPPGRYVVDANCIPYKADQTLADNRNLIINRFHMVIDLEPNVFVDLIPDPAVMGYTTDYGVPVVGCGLKPKGLNRVTNQWVPVRYELQ